MIRNVTDSQLEIIATHLIGQCVQGIDSVAEEIGAPEFELWSLADCFAFDALAFECERCGWWVADDDHADEEPDGQFICSDCGNEDNYEECS